MCDKNVCFDAKFERNSTLNMCHTNPRLQRKYEIRKTVRNRKTLYCGLSFFLCVHGHTVGYVRIVRKYKSLFEEYGIAEADWTIYSATTFLESYRKVVREIWFEKSGSRNLVREKWLTRKKGGFIP